jgi:teichuronic acid biosynthesis glycosyltransferase TuaG
MNELISVILPAFNSERFIKNSLESALSQTHTELEVVVIDDASSDKTVQIIEMLCASDHRVRLLRQPANRGPGAARNRGIGAARGRYLAFLDADDVWEPQKLERQLEYMKTNNLAFSYTPVSLISESGVFLGRYMDGEAQERVGYLDMLRKKSMLVCSTVMLNRELTGHLMLPDLRSGQDYCLWLSILKRGIDAFCLRVPLTRYRIVPGSVSSNKLRKARRQWEIYRKHEKLPVLASAWYFCNYAFRAIWARRPGVLMNVSIRGREEGADWHGTG